MLRLALICDKGTLLKKAFRLCRFPSLTAISGLAPFVSVFECKAGHLAASAAHKGDVDLDTLPLRLTCDQGEREGGRKEGL